MSREHPSVLTRALRPFQRLVRSRLRLRALLAVLAVALVALVAFDVAAVSALSSYLMDQTDTSLRNAASLARPGLNGLPEGTATPTLSADGRLVMNEPDAMVEHELGTWVSNHQFIVGLYGVTFFPKTGIALAVEDGAAPATWAEDGPNVPVNLSGIVVNGQVQNTVSVFGAPLRVVAVATAHGTVVISTSLSGVHRTVDRMRLIMIIGSAAAVLLIGLGAFWLLRRGLRPVETMATQADRITAGNLTDRVTPQDPRSEVGRLGSALNGMLARIEASVQEQEADQELMRRFFADASHELRTPLASLRANAELYQQGALSERAQVDEVMRRIGLEARRMSGLVDDMLRLARLDQHPEQQREPVELTELVACCVERMLVAAPEHVWHVDIEPGVVVVGDEELLRRAVDNLLANVRAHTPAGTETTVALCDRDGTVEIEISDTGPGVPPDRLPRIFDRFYRAETGPCPVPASAWPSSSRSPPSTTEP